MPVKIRLQRHGKKGKPFYWIVAADSRTKRDGRYLEKLGVYNPNTNPAHIELNIDGAVTWLQNGAQPTDTARAILSYKGALLKNHLIGGVRKGALTEEQVEERFNAWLEDKAKLVENKRANLADAKEKARAEALAAEKAVNEARAAAALEETVVEEQAETASATTEETPAAEETQAASEVSEETQEATEETPTAEATEKAPAAEETQAASEEVSEETQEATEETPAAEETAEETEEAPAAEKTEATEESSEEETPKKDAE